MLIFTKDFNSCKTVSCDNFGIEDSPTYIQKSERLGYLSTECALCGSNPPWINNTLIHQVLSEKLNNQFGHKIIGCPKCSPYFFMTPEPESTRNGYTVAGTRRKKCKQCATVFTVPDYKNVAALKAVLASVLSTQEIKTAIKETGLSSRLYYFYLNKLALIFANFSRLTEALALQREYLGMHSEGRVIHLNHQRGLYALFTAEISSGYILLQSNNLTKQSVGDDFIYHETESTLASNIVSTNIEEVLLARYHSNLKRNHFEQLIIGNIKPIKNCHAIYPDKVAYIHFQLLKALTFNVEKYDHYIEHESTLRSASLISSYSSIINKSANVYFFVPFKGNTEHLKGKPLGWWNDIWFGNEDGAICPITCKLKEAPSTKLQKNDAINSFTEFINKSLNKNSNSMKVIDNLSEIYRVIYNFCEPKNKQTAAILLGLTNKTYQPGQLLDEALKSLQAK